MIAVTMPAVDLSSIVLSFGSGRITQHRGPLIAFAQPRRVPDDVIAAKRLGYALY